MSIRDEYANPNPSDNNKEFNTSGEEHFGQDSSDIRDQFSKKERIELIIQLRNNFKDWIQVGFNEDREINDIFAEHQFFTHMTNYYNLDKIFAEGIRLDAGLLTSHALPVFTPEKEYNQQEEGHFSQLLFSQHHKSDTAVIIAFPIRELLEKNLDVQDVMDFREKVPEKYIHGALDLRNIKDSSKKTDNRFSYEHNPDFYPEPFTEEELEDRNKPKGPESRSRDSEDGSKDDQNDVDWVDF